MALVQDMITLSNTTKTLVSGDCKSIVIDNLSGATIYLGNSAVTTSSYGTKLDSGQIVTIPDLQGDLYAISSVNGSQIGILVSK